MKIDRLIWGILFLFVGGVLLLDNFHVIEFYWRNVWQFWPVFLIIIGINVLLGKKESNIGGYVSIAILVLTLGYLFFRGQEKPERNSWFGNRIHTNWNFDDENDNNDNWDENTDKASFIHQFSDKPNATLNLYCGGSGVELTGTTDSLISVLIKGKGNNFEFENDETDANNSVTTLRNKNKKGSWNINTGSNDLKLQLNKMPIWEMNMKMGAGDIHMDLTDYKVEKFTFEGGAAALDLKLGSETPVSTVHVKTGVADVKVSIPKDAGCRIISKTGLSVKDFDGFDKKNGNTYETANFATAKNKIYLNFDGGLSNFEVKRY